MRTKSFLVFSEFAISCSSSRIREKMSLTRKMGKLAMTWMKTVSQTWDVFSEELVSISSPRWHTFSGQPTQKPLLDALGLFSENADELLAGGDLEVLGLLPKRDLVSPPGSC